MLQQEVTAFPGPDLDEPRSLELPDDFSPRHVAMVNLSLGSVNARRRRPSCVSPVCSNLVVVNDDLYWRAVNAKGRGAAAWTFRNEAFFYATNSTYPYGLLPEEL